MKVIFVNAIEMQGKSKKDGSPYHFATLRYAVPVEPVSRENLMIRGFGYEVKELSLDPNAVPAFVNVKPFTEVDVRLEPRPQNPNQNQVVGLVAQNVKAAS